MMKIVFKCCALLLFLTGSSSVTAEVSRFALVIGNGGYSSIGALPNPPADAKLMATTLGDLGFDITLAVDSSQYEMKKAIADFGRKLRKADKSAIGFFYYAGHGIQAKGRNYLLPVEATPTDETDLDLMGVEANWVLRQMESAGNRTNIMVLDACRNNPFVSANRSLGRGLAQIDAPTGSFISYATAPGKVALDGDTANSPFTIALANRLSTGGSPIEQVFKQVRIDVIRATNGEQIPWDSSSLVEDVYMKPAEVVPVQEIQTTAAETELWESVRDTGDTAKLSYFLQVYPDSAYAEDARKSMLDTMMSANAAKQASLTSETSKDTSESSTTIVVAENTAATRSYSEEDDMAMFQTAQTSLAAEDFEQYLQTYPDGIFASLAEAELENIKASATASQNATPSTSTSAASTPETISQAKVESDSDAAAIEKEIPVAPALEDTAPDKYTYVSPIATLALGTGTSRSIEQMSQGTPLHAPFEGLEESYWKAQNCSNCHAWDQPALCTQGKFYLGVDVAALERIKHPYGGAFKTALQQWAEVGCQ